MRSLVSAFMILMMLGVPALADNFANGGENWSGSWNFGTATDRSLMVQQAQAIRDAQAEGPQTVITYNNYNDNRSGYVEVTNAAGSSGTTEARVGDDIGQQTYSVGSLNTGSTEIEIEGSGNVVTATNSSDSNGCVDGSISMTATGMTPASPVTVGNAATATGYLQAIAPCAQR